MAHNFILASSSPRRKQLLTAAGFSFIIDVPSCDEHTTETRPEQYVLNIAKRKAMDVAGRHPGEVVLAADTVVWYSGPINKPEGPADAFRILRMLSGNQHEVFTGVCAFRDGAYLAQCERSIVRFRPISDDEICDYIATGEPMDKAGAYGAQGIGGGFIEEIIGNMDNVMGLPTALSCALLEHFGVPCVGVITNYVPGNSGGSKHGVV